KIKKTSQDGLSHTPGTSDRGRNHQRQRSSYRVFCTDRFCSPNLQFGKFIGRVFYPEASPRGETTSDSHWHGNRDSQGHTGHLHRLSGFEQLSHVRATCDLRYFDVFYSRCLRLLCKSESSHSNLVFDQRIFSFESPTP